MSCQVLVYKIFLGLYLYHYGKVDVTMEIHVAAEKQQWTVEAGSMLDDNSTNRSVLISILGFSYPFFLYLLFK